MKAKILRMFCLFFSLCMFTAFASTAGQAANTVYKQDSGIVRLQSKAARQDLPALSGNGDAVLVNSRQSFQFTPDFSGPWLIYTTDAVNCDPRLILQDALGNEITQDDDSGGDMNARINTILRAESAYTIVTDFYDNTGSFNLIVQPVPIEILPGNGGQVMVSQETLFQFTPTSSGKWGFTTSNSEGDPTLLIFNQFDELIGQDDDSGGGLDANLMVNLEAGSTYKLQASSFGTPGPYQLSAAPVAVAVLPGGGGEVVVNQPTYFQFSPADNGRWEFVTSNSAGHDPSLTLYDRFGAIISSDDDSAGDLNARISTILEQGRQYSLYADFYDANQGSYTLTAARKQDERLPEHGGAVIVSQPTYFEFIPATSGRWSFRTSNNGDSDPLLQLYDNAGVQLAYADDSSDLNAHISAQLQAGASYIVYVDFFTPGTCIFNVEQTSAVALPSAGGTVRVDQAGFFELTPGTSGRWMLFTSSIDSVDPFMTLSDANGAVIQHDDDSSGNLNAYITASLDAGVTYSIELGYYGEAGQIDLTVQPLKYEVLPPNGGIFQVNGRTMFEFTPLNGGAWEFVTSDNNGDPVLSLLDAYETELTTDDDRAGNMNAHIVYDLQPGRTYLIDAHFFFPENGSYKLHVRPQPSNAAPLFDSKEAKG